MIYESAPTSAEDHTGRRLKKCYRGGWSTSICDLFQDPRRKGDCCALACCGVLLADRNRHLLKTIRSRRRMNNLAEVENADEQEEQMTEFQRWVRRIVVYFIVPVVAVIVVSVVGFILFPQPDEDTDSDSFPYDGIDKSGSSKPYKPPESEESEEEDHHDPNFLSFWAQIGVVIALLCLGRSRRLKSRESLLRLMHQIKKEREEAEAEAAESEPSETDGPNGEKIENGARPVVLPSRISAQGYLLTNSNDTSVAHSVCCRCYQPDVTYRMEDTSGVDDDENNFTPCHMSDSPPHKQDLCTWIWNVLAGLCCVHCGCGLMQCCGMCAIGQEGRELESILVSNAGSLTATSQDLQIDFITFEPYSNYYRKIVELRRTMNGSFSAHLEALSKLSRVLLKILVVLILMTVGIGILVQKGVVYAKIAMLFATLLQAFGIVFVLHWPWNRFDLSMDAVIKYFSCGFVICVLMAVAYETLVAIVVGSGALMVVFFDFESEIKPNMSQKEIMELSFGFTKDHLGLIAFALALNAFLVAAFVEELVKYFGFWMLEHPDLMDPNDIAVSPEPTGENGSAARSSQNPEEERSDESSFGNSDSGLVLSSTNTPPHRSLKSRGAATTIAIVTVAAGFACGENLMYIFSPVGGGTVEGEFITLVLRSLLPLHEVAAAIQAIGVVRRDVEGDESHQLGRIVLPAILLHGGYDFVLMVFGLFEMAEKQEEEVEEVEQMDDQLLELTEPPKEDLNWKEVAKSWASLICGFGLMVLGILYYIIAAARQRKRLVELERLHHPRTQGLTMSSSNNRLV